MLDAMAIRIPVVATRVGGIPEVIEEGDGGLLVNSRNPRQLADAIMKLGRDQSLRKKMGEAGLEKVQKQYSRETICTQYEKLYTKLLARRKR